MPGPSAQRSAGTNAAGHGLIRQGEILPHLTLSGPGGAPSVPWPGRHATILVVAHPGPCAGCTRYLDELSGSITDLQEWATRLLGVRSQCDEGHPFPLLGDVDGTARQRLGIKDGQAAVILADRWGEVVEAAAVGADHAFPLPHQLVESAKIVDLSCGECNVPSEEWRAVDT